MKAEKPVDSGVIAVFVEGLQDTPGWVTLSRKKQDDLLAITSDVQQFRGMKQLGEFGELMKLTEAAALLEGEEMRMRDYLSKLYPLDHQRTIQRKQEAFAELAATIPNGMLKRFGKLGQDVLSQFDRIATAALGDIRNAVKAMPLLPVNTDKDPGEFLHELNGKLLEERKNRRRVGMDKPSKEMIENMALNALVGYDKDANLKTSAERRQFATRLVGWYMEARAVSGTVNCKRLSIPESFRLGPGRPRMSAEEKEQARLERIKAKNKEAA